MDIALSGRSFFGKNYLKLLLSRNELLLEVSDPDVANEMSGYSRIRLKKLFDFCELSGYLGGWRPKGQRRQRGFYRDYG